MQADHRRAGAVVLRGNVEQLFRRHDLLKRRGYAAAAACLTVDPRTEYSSAGYDRRYPEHGGDGEGGGAFEIRDDRCIEPSASDHVSVLPEVF